MSRVLQFSEICMSQCQFMSCVCFGAAPKALNDIVLPDRVIEWYFAYLQGFSL